MAFDDRLFDQLERKNKAETRRRRERFVVEAEADREASAPQPEDFLGGEVPDIPDSQIRRDSQKAQQLAARYDRPTKSHFLASALELVVNTGVNEGVFFAQDEEGSMVESINTNKFDDYVNRVDTAVTIHRESQEDITFAIDLYSGDNPDTAIQKIAQSTNERRPRSTDFANEFAGFTEIRYYQDNEGTKKRLRHVPRFCIGVCQDDILNAVDEVGGTGNMFRTVGMSTVRFKMLYEMVKQTELFASYLDVYGRSFEEADADEEYQKAYEDLNQLHKMYMRELVKARKVLGYGDMSNEEVAKMFAKGDSVFKTIIGATEKLADDEFDTEEEDPQDSKKARYSGKRIIEALSRLIPPKPSTA